MFDLENGQLIVYPNKYFFIKGDIDDYKEKLEITLCL